MPQVVDLSPDTHWQGHRRARLSELKKGTIQSTCSVNSAFPLTLRVPPDYHGSDNVHPLRDITRQVGLVTINSRVRPQLRAFRVLEHPCAEIRRESVRDLSASVPLSARIPATLFDWLMSFNLMSHQHHRNQRREHQGLFPQPCDIDPHFDTFPLVSSSVQ